MAAADPLKAPSPDTSDDAEPDLPGEQPGAVAAATADFVAGDH